MVLRRITKARSCLKQLRLARFLVRVAALTCHKNLTRSHKIQKKKADIERQASSKCINSNHRSRTSSFWIASSFPLISVDKTWTQRKQTTHHLSLNSTSSLPRIRTLSIWRTWSSNTSATETSILNITIVRSSDRRCTQIVRMRSKLRTATTSSQRLGSLRSSIRINRRWPYFWKTTRRIFRLWCYRARFWRAKITTIA